MNPIGTMKEPTQDGQILFIQLSPNNKIIEMESRFMVARS
jgi:hypothetical protein